MANLNDELQRMVQRSGANTGRMRTEAERAAFASSVRTDIASIMYQLNTVYYELASTLSNETDINALDKGLAGNSIFTHVDATAASADAYWSSDLSRTRTIKETVDVLLAEITRLENEIQSALNADEYDDTELRGLIQGNSLDLQQLAIDTMGANYTLDGDGAANLTYPISQHLDAIGAFFAGYPSSGNSYTAVYPALSLTILLSSITIDTTLAQSVITGLSADLGYIRTFIGMDTTGPETPTYSTYGGLTNLVDGDSLEESLYKLDSVTGSSTLQASYSAGGAGTAGEILLSNALGAISIIDDGAAALGTLFNWKSGAGVIAGILHVEGVDLAADKWLTFVQSTGPLVSVAGEGRLHTLPDLTSTDTELFYQNSNAGTGEAQVTRDGIVKELEVGHDHIPAELWKKFTADAGPVVVTEEYGVSPSGIVLTTLDFDTATEETAYGHVKIPTDEDGNRPTRLRISATFLLKPNGGAYPGGTGIAFGVSLPDSTSATTLGNKTPVSPGWQTPTIAFDNTLGAGNIDQYVELEWSVSTLAANPAGLLPIRISRVVGNANDSWDNDVGLVSAQVVWYR